MSSTMKKIVFKMVMRRQRIVIAVLVAVGVAVVVA
jgi:hypothetical protein